MGKGISIHVGLNHVDPKQYEGWDGALNACVADATDMRALAKKCGFKENLMLLNEAATAKAVAAAIGTAAKSLGKGDMLFLTYSGHGGQVKDRNNDEKDRMDETWVLFDRELVDDELYTLWGQFKAGVRILTLSDSCHSGTVAKDFRPSLNGGPRPRFMPRPIAEQVERAHAPLYRKIQMENKGSEKAKVGASILLISGCMDNQTSMDGDHNGAFTGALKKVWAGGKFKGGYRSFRDKIVAGMPSSQTPNYYFIGATNPIFEAQKPFTI